MLLPPTFLSIAFLPLLLRPQATSAQRVREFRDDLEFITTTELVEALQNSECRNKTRDMIQVNNTLDSFGKALVDYEEELSRAFARELAFCLGEECEIDGEECEECLDIMPKYEALCEQEGGVIFEPELDLVCKIESIDKAYSNKENRDQPIPGSVSFKFELEDFGGCFYRECNAEQVLDAFKPVAISFIDRFEKRYATENLTSASCWGDVEVEDRSTVEVVRANVAGVRASSSSRVSILVSLASTLAGFLFFSCWF